MTQQAKEERRDQKMPRKLISRSSEISKTQQTTTSRDKSISRSHVIECRRVNKKEDLKHEGGSARQQRIEIVEKSSARARQRHRTKENISASNSPLFSVKTTNPIQEDRGRKPKTVPQKPTRTRHTSVKEPKIETKQNQSLESVFNENRKVVIENKHKNSAKHLELETVPSSSTEHGELSESVQNEEKRELSESVQNEEKAVENVDISDDDEDTQNDKLVKMLKKIDTQTLKRRLSLDKLDDLDTDDEVMGNKISL